MVQVRELLHLGYRLYPPHPALQPWVECYWSVEGANPADATPERIYPDGGSSLIFDLSGNSQDTASFSAHQSPGTLRPVGAKFGIRLKPSGARALLGLPIQDLAGGSYPCADIGIRSAADVQARLLDADELQRVHIADEWLLRQYVRLNPEPGAVEHVMSQLVASNSLVQDVVADSGISQRSMERLFRASTGTSLRQLKAWRRIKRARYLIKLHPDWPLTHIGLTCGYYDQAHFIHQFKRATTFTPGDYRERQIKRLMAEEMAVDHV